MVCAFLLITASIFQARADADFMVYADSSGIRFAGASKFGMDNAAPGDTAVADLEIVNNSNQTIRLGIDSNFREGERLLYEKLIVVIRSRLEELYNGPLSELEHQSLGAFQPGTSELFQLELGFPTDVGNDCQGQGIRLDLSVHELGSADRILPVSGTNADLLLPLGLLLFFLGLLYLRVGKNEQRE